MKRIFVFLAMVIFFTTGCASTGLTANNKVSKEAKKQEIIEKIAGAEKTAEYLQKKINELKSNSIYRIYEAYNISLSQTNFELKNLKLELKKLESPKKPIKQGGKKKK